MEPDLDEPLSLISEVDLHVTAMIPPDYLPDVHQRLVLYKRISQASSDKSLDQLQVEMIDRFGLLPQEVKNLFQPPSSTEGAQPGNPTPGSRACRWPGGVRPQARYQYRRTAEDDPEGSPHLRTAGQ
jgi:hypothetical protein